MVTKKSSQKKSVAPKAKAVKQSASKAKKLKPAKSAKTSAATSLKKGTLSIKKPFTTSQLVEHLSMTTGVKKKEIVHVLETIAHVMEGHLSKKGPGEMNFAGIFKCRTVHKPATKARQGTNPFTGKPMMFAAKPAHLTIRIRPLKKLKQMVS
jgi:nucleoid DNA-binding protein